MTVSPTHVVFLLTFVCCRWSARLSHCLSDLHFPHFGHRYCIQVVLATVETFISICCGYRGGFLLNITCLPDFSWVIYLSQILYYRHVVLVISFCHIDRWLREHIGMSSSCRDRVSTRDLRCRWLHTWWALVGRIALTSQWHSRMVTFGVTWNTLYDVSLSVIGYSDIYRTKGLCQCENTSVLAIYCGSWLSVGQGEISIGSHRHCLVIAKQKGNEEYFLFSV